MSTITWTCIEPGDPDDITTRVYRSDDGSHVLAKEWYAQGPSLFSWMLYETATGLYDHTCSFVQEFNTKKAATRFLESKGF